jgi:hypothetical protein
MPTRIIPIEATARCSARAAAIPDTTSSPRFQFQLTAREVGLCADRNPAGNKLDAWPLNPDSAAGVEVCSGAVDRNAGTWPARRKWLPFIAPLRSAGISTPFASEKQAVVSHRGLTRSDRVRKIQILVSICANPVRVPGTRW